MSTVRFSKVIEKSGRPEIFLLLNPKDPQFRKALKACRIMTLRGPEGSTGSEHGEVGHDPKRRGQILLFPRSLKIFEGAKVVGIHYDLISGAGENNRKSPGMKTLRKIKAPKPRRAAKPPSKTPTLPAEKIIPFPRSQPAKEEEADTELEYQVRKALLQLEKGNSVAAYNLLKRAIRG